MKHQLEIFCLNIFLGSAILFTPTSSSATEKKTGTVGSMKWEVTYTGKNNRGNGNIYNCVVKNRKTKKVCVKQPIVWINITKASSACPKMAYMCDKKAS